MVNYDKEPNLSYPHKFILNSLSLLNGQIEILRGEVARTNQSIVSLENTIKESARLLRRSVLVVILGFCVYRIGSLIEDKLTAEVSKLADVNKDSITSAEEWIPVYKELGIPYDALHPKEIPTLQRIKYINNHKHR